MMVMEKLEKRRIALAIKEHMARLRMSRETFAFKTKLGKSTVDKLLTGIFSARTLSMVEEAMNVRFRNFDLIEERADLSLGGYLRSDVSIYEGGYLFLRASFKENRTIYAFPMDIVWDDQTSGLSLREIEGSNRSQSGALFIPKVSFHVFVYSHDASCTRHMILSRMDNTYRMRGLMLTLANTMANAFTPVTVPIVLVKQEVNEADVGKIDVEHPLYEVYKAELKEAEDRGFYVQIAAKNL